MIDSLRSVRARQPDDLLALGDGEVLHVLAEVGLGGGDALELAGGLVDGDVDPGRLVARGQQVAAGQLHELDLVEGVCRVRHELPDEHLPIRVHRVDHQVQQLLDLGLEAVFRTRHVPSPRRDGMGNHHPADDNGKADATATEAG